MIKRINISIPATLHKECKIHKIKVSKVCQVALDEAVEKKLNLDASLTTQLDKHKDILAMLAELLEAYKSLTK